MSFRAVSLVFIILVLPSIFGIKGIAPVERETKSNEQTESYTLVQNAARRENISGNQIKNVTVNVYSRYSQGNHTEYCNLSLYFSEEPQVRGEYQLLNPRYGQFRYVNKSYMRLGTPINESKSFENLMFQYDYLRWDPAIEEDVYNEAILDFFKQYGLSRTFYIQGNVTGYPKEDNLPGDAIVRIGLDIELTNGSIISTKRISVAFGGYYSIDQGANGTFLELIFDFTDLELPKVTDVKILPNNPATDLDAMLIKFSAFDNTFLSYVTVVWQTQDGINKSGFIPPRDFESPPFFLLLGKFTIGTWPIWIYLSDVSAWDDEEVYGPIYIEINKGPDVAAPEITVLNQTLLVDDSTSYLLFTTFDENPSYVEIYTDDKMVYNNTWYSGNFKISLSSLGLRPGIYNMTAIFYDTLGYSTSVNFWLTVRTNDLVPLVALVLLLLISVIPISVVIYRRYKGKTLHLLPETSNLVLLYMTLKQVLEGYYKLLSSNIISDDFDVEAEKPTSTELVPTSFTTALHLKIENLFELPPQEVLAGLHKLNLRKVSDKSLKVLIYLTTRWPNFITPGEIADTLGIKKSTLSRILAALEEEEYLVQKPGIVDSRNKFMRITKKGVDMLEELTVHLEYALRQQNLI
ncbi:MAG: MarR family winged helix-turn-helix transcriptional regulator [Candidatus Hodarchaeales archaeon]